MWQLPYLCDDIYQKYGILPYLNNDNSDKLKVYLKYIGIEDEIESYINKFQNQVVDKVDINQLSSNISKSVNIIKMVINDIVASSNLLENGKYIFDIMKEYDDSAKKTKQQRDLIKKVLTVVNEEHNIDLLIIYNKIYKTKLRIILKLPKTILSETGKTITNKLTELTDYENRLTRMTNDSQNMLNEATKNLTLFEKGIENYTRVGKYFKKYKSLTKTEIEERVKEYIIYDKILKNDVSFEEINYEDNQLNEELWNPDNGIFIHQANPIPETIVTKKPKKVSESKNKKVKDKDFEQMLANICFCVLVRQKEDKVRFGSLIKEITMEIPEHSLYGSKEIIGRTVRKMIKLLEKSN